jgi:hypothetical protein
MRLTGVMFRSGSADSGEAPHESDMSSAPPANSITPSTRQLPDADHVSAMS